MVTRLQASGDADGPTVLAILDGLGREHDDAEFREHVRPALR